MRRILIIKTSSLGDVVHALPAVSDIATHYPEVAIDWLVEEGFAPVPTLHPAVANVIPVATRRWRHALFSPRTWHDLGILQRRLHEDPYDLVLDLQGLIKSAALSRLVPARRAGYVWACAREPLASLAYQEKFFVPWTLHAVERNRQLAAQSMRYVPDAAIRYGLEAPPTPPDWMAPGIPYAILLHATSRSDKEWPEGHWVKLGQALAAADLGVVIPGGSARERSRSQRLASRIPGARSAPPMDLARMAALLAHARCVVGVDTGLTHLAAALGRPTVAIFTATRPEDTGVYGSSLAVNCGGKHQVPSVETVLQSLPVPC